jgi:hypothetical protein
MEVTGKYAIKIVTKHDENFHLQFCLSFRSVNAVSQFLLHIFLLTPIDKDWS